MVSRSDFVLERRVNQPLPVLRSALMHPALGAPQPVVLGAGSFRFQGRFSVHPSPIVARHDSYQATGELLTLAGRRVADVEVELSPWSNDVSALQLRPLARHPERWRGRRLRSYFDLAHTTADRIAGSLQVQPEPTMLVREFVPREHWGRVA
jgi:hypothetical protein